MRRTVTTISIEPAVRNKAREILKLRGMTLSFYIEQTLRKLIDMDNKN